MATAGYSQTPLAKKLGIKEGYRVRLVNAPAHYHELFTDMPQQINFVTDSNTTKHLVHYFTTAAATLQRDITSLRKEIFPNGSIWISWPKKASKVPTDITEDTIRTMALANGLVDVKVCAVDDVWSGLKLVVPVKDR